MRSSGKTKTPRAFVMAGQKRVFALDVPAIYVLAFLNRGRRGCPAQGSTRPGMTSWSTSYRTSQMREIMRQCFDFLLAQGIGDIRHRRHAAAGSRARLVIMQLLEQIFLALARNAGDGLGAGKCIGVA